MCAAMFKTEVFIMLMYNIYEKKSEIITRVGKL